MRSTRKYAAAGVAMVATAALLSTAGTPAQGTSAAAGLLTLPVNTAAELQPLNNASGHGHADVTIQGRRVDVSLDAKRMLRGLPHAKHIHFGAKARHECPTVFDDDNADHRINTSEGQPAYGPVKVSLTKRGDTSPDSTLAVNRYPTAADRHIHYDREGIHVSKRVARAIRHGNAVVVVHGIDYNGNGRYDFGAGKSDLDPALPAEATDPAICGVLHVVDDTPLPAQ